MEKTPNPQYSKHAPKDPIKRWPLRYYVVLPVALLFALSMALSAIFSYQMSASLVDRFLNKQSDLIYERITEQLDAFLSDAIKVSFTNQALFANHILKTDDIDPIGAHFVSQIQNAPFLTFVSIGLPTGEYIGANRNVNTGEISLYTAIQREGGTFNQYSLDANNHRLKKLSTGNHYDATKRPWYVAALDKGMTTWYPVYKYVTQNALGVGVSTPVYDEKTHQLLGVVTGDLALNRINAYLKSIDVGNSGVVFVAEPNRNLVASSSQIPVYQEISGTFIRETLVSIKDPRLNAASSYMNFAEEGKPHTLVQVGKDTYHFQYSHYKDQYGQNLIVGVLLSDKDFATTYQNEFFKWFILTLSVLLVLGAILVIILRQVIIPPIRTLNKAYQNVQNGDFNIALPLSGSKEMVELTLGFNKMAQSLEHSKEIEKAYIAQEKMAALGALVSGVTHEVNTPLGIAIMSASYLDKNHQELLKKLNEGTLTKNDFMQFSEENAESIEMLQSNLNRAADLIQSFKVVSSNQSTEIATTFNLKSLIDHVILSLKHEYKKKGISFTIHCDANLTLYSFPSAITQILTNLIMNSIIHGFKVKSTGTIEIQCQAHEDHIVLEYRDNGDGMSAEVLGKLFTPFFTTNRENGGTGIGMNIVQGIVKEKLNGTIEVQSELNQGVYFRIEFDNTALMTHLNTLES